MPGLVKIGMTDQDDVGVRVGQLYSTGVPLPFTIEFAGVVPNPAEVEEAFHVAFAPHRINPKREFFRIEPEQAIAILKLLHVDDATAAVVQEPTFVDAQSLAAAEIEKKRRPRFNFEEMHIPIGSVLINTRTGDAATVVGGNKVLFSGEEYALSALTKKILNLPYYVSPAAYWTFQGKLFGEIYDETYAA
jgi:Meiotically up-regulated gene 113